MRDRVFLITIVLLINTLSALGGAGVPGIIDNPKENDMVTGNVFVTGLLPSDLSENQNLWIAVKPLNDAKCWYPQTNGAKLTTVGGAFNGNAYLNGSKGDRFEIAILLVDDEINDKFMLWENNSRAAEPDDWACITQGHTGANDSVAKDVIEAHKLDKVIVVFNP
jgi:hypothetical protein